MSSQLNDRASDMSGKSIRTDGSGGVFAQQILRSFKQKEYSSLKPVLAEAAERQKSSAGSVGRAGRSPAESARKARLASVRSKNSAAHMRSLEANNSKPHLRFQTIGSQEQSSNSKQHARPAQSTAMEALAQPPSDGADQLKPEPEFSHQVSKNQP